MKNYIKLEHFPKILKRFYALGFVIFTLFGTNALAEGGCPEGMRPIYGVTGNIVNCVEFYDPNQGQNNDNSGQNNANKGYWVDSYASLIFAREKNGGLVYTYGSRYNTQRDADYAALDECTIRKYTDCKIVLQFGNGYFAIATDDKSSLYSGSEFEEAGAKKSALQNCKKHNGVNCRVFKVVNNRARWVAQ